MTDVAETKPLRGVKTPAEVQSVPEPPRPPKGWEPMDTAPRDGKTIIVRSALDEHGAVWECLAIWRNARRFNQVTCRWEAREWWAQANAGGLPVTFECVGWKPRAGIE